MSTRGGTLSRAAAAPVICAICIICVLCGVGIAAQKSTPIDKAFEAYWKADEQKDAVKAADRLLVAGVDFDTAWARLRAGRPYKKEKTGAFSFRFSGPNGTLFENDIEVPEDYDPSRPWQVRVQLHGGVGREAPASIFGGGRDVVGEEGQGAGRGDGPPRLSRRRGENRIPGVNQIYVQPHAWRDAAWWDEVQVDNILRTLDRLKRRYNVDESHVYLTGISDGGTGAYYIATHEATAFSAFLPLNGSIKVLGNPAVGADGETYSSNLVNRPLYIVNGGQDPLYPVAHVETHVAVFEDLGVDLVFNPQPMAGHDTSWWPWVRGPFEQFVTDHPRPANPAGLSWRTERTDRFNRIQWLVIDALGDVEGQASFDSPEFFDHAAPSGRVDVSREGNTFTADTEGVTAFTLLLSPDVVDFARPVTVEVNGRTAFNGRVERDVKTLLSWAARDDDRTMLYGAAVKIQVPAP
jgi:predicted esterase